MTGAGKAQYHGPPNGHYWPMTLPKGLNIVLFPYFNARMYVFYRLSQAPALINKTEQFIADWTGLKNGAGFTPTNLMIVTWPDSYDSKWPGATVGAFI